MKLSKNSLALAAAFAGLAGGTAARAAQVPSSVDAHSSAVAGWMASDFQTKTAIEKHACKGLNSCKGNGGGDEKQFGKNACKGQGACATDGSNKKK